jgi:hypothetical protein
VTRYLLVLALVAAAATAAIFTNLALLDYGSGANDRVGKLTPRAHLPAAPADVIRPRTGTVRDPESDD